MTASTRDTGHGEHGCCSHGPSGRVVTQARKIGRTVRHREDLPYRKSVGGDGVPGAAGQALGAVGVAGVFVPFFFLENWDEIKDRAILFVRVPVVVPETRRPLLDHLDLLPHLEPPALEASNRSTFHHVSMGARLSDIVNVAFGLTPYEIQFMWATAPHRMPSPPDDSADLP